MTKYKHKQMYVNKCTEWHADFQLSGPILESKGMGVTFQKKGKIFESLGKNRQNLKIFQKRAGDCM